MYIVPTVHYSLYVTFRRPMPLRALLLTSISFLFLAACHNVDDVPSSASTEELPFQTLALANLDDFQAMEATNWQTAGSVYADRQVAEDLQPTEGEGVLANLPDDQNRANLFTTWEHSDIDLSLDFMLPKGSNSGIYLQGRYEVQLLDSWGQDSVNSGDCGGIYQRWREAEQQGYEGHAPRLNASRAPGLWQRLDITFIAPRFDEQGKKVSDARFAEVMLNGVVIQKDVVVSGPTRGAAFDDEKPAGPLMIQGDHGPVAFQDIRYKTYQTTPIRLTDLTYQIYEGTYEDPATLEATKPVQQGTTDSISYQFGNEYENYALVFEGSLEAPIEGEYLFTLQSAGPSWLYLEGKEAISNGEAKYMNQSGRYQATLTEGSHSFRLVYTKYAMPWIKGLALYGEGPEIHRQALHVPGSVPQSDHPEPIIVQANEQPTVQRAFMYHRGEKKTHCTAVGLPTGMNYAVDIKDAALLSAWGGGFLDVTDMWHERGEPQTAQPLGSALELADKPTFARLPSHSAPWPDSVAFDQPYLQTKGYSLNPRGIPVFHYQLGQTLIDDYLYSGDAERKLVRDIKCTFSDTSGDPVYCLLAEGDLIEQLPDGSYGVDGKKYYLTVEQAGKNKIEKRTNQGKEQLLAAMVPEGGQASLQYAIIW